ncbi:LysM peptidoglycan-binding domain-containing protein [Butyrivibrio sp. FCS006]|uniref:LysM peptidoglycan-binding domain-containing protein n=1 Tax=Butyrivibrio sp. FCS006 TaxID=1280684 RepID=UPI0006861BDF|nr:LysM peptidoglycan-binding domain-containing protein [Butyrivibrio sp. FCS006]
MSEAMRAAASLYNNPRYNSVSEIRIQQNKIRRQRIVRRQYFLLGLTIAFVIFLFAFIGTTVMSSAQSDEYEPSFKYYKTVTVHSDETLWNIANANFSEDNYDNINEYIGEICTINAISDPDTINAGEDIVVPYYSAEFK